MLQRETGAYNSLLFLYNLKFVFNKRIALIWYEGFFVIGCLNCDSKILINLFIIKKTRIKQIWCDCNRQIKTNTNG